MAGRALTITYLADAKSVLAAQGQIDAGHTAMQSTTAKTGGVFQQTFGSLMPIAAAAAGAAVLKFGVDSVKAAIESEQAMAQTEARLKSTGGAANVTADDVVGLAGRLRDLTGVDDETIQASENLLLSFTKVRNEVGKGNDIFNQAEGAALDLATALNKGAVPSADQLQSATIQLGKALNDPIAGLSKLSRAGVDFTEKQKEQIRILVESGDIMGAQKIILGELSQEFGGAAEAAGDTFGGQVAILQSKLGDLEEDIGRILIPLLLELAQTAQDVVGPFAELVNQINGVTTQSEEAGFSIGGLYHGLVELANPIEAVRHPIGRFQEAWHEVSGTTDEVTEKLKTNRGVVGDLADFYRGRFAEAMDTAAEKNKINERATRALTDAQREQRLAVLALTDSYLGILDSASDVTEAQKELNRLERAGKDDTKAYEQAVLDALEAQVGLEDAVLSYAEDLADSGETQREVKQKVKDLADQFGIQDDVVRELLRKIQDYIRELNNIPEHVNTNITTTGSGGSSHQQLQHGGIVTRPTVALIGEAGPEAVIPLSKGKGVAAGVNVNVTIGTVVGPGGVEEVVAILKRELVKDGFRNVDIFGGRA